jgi:hypothetical protein
MSHFAANAKRLTWAAVTPAHFEQFCRLLAHEGVEMPADEGEAKIPGRSMTIQWKYNREGQTLTLECVKKPVTVGQAYVNWKLTQMVEGFNGNHVDQ